MNILVKFILTCVISGLSLSFAGKAQAISILRDAEMEYAMDVLARPILQAAGLPAAQYQIFIVDDSSLNAFVFSGKYIFIHKGLIQRIERPDMLQAVLAHETAHLAAQHSVTRSLALGGAKRGAAAGLVLAALVEILSNGDSDGAGVGLALGTQSAAQRGFFGHTRGEETIADEWGAQYLRRAGVPLKGIVDVMRIFEGQEALSHQHQDAYTRTHPLSRDRVTRMLALSDSLGDVAENSPTAIYWFDRLRAALRAYDRQTLPKGLQPDAEALYNAMRAHRAGQTDKAITLARQVLARRPNDALIHARLGEFYLVAGRASEALRSYEQALAHDRDSLILHGAGRAAFAAGRPKSALKYFQAASKDDWFNARLLQDMSLAYGQLGQTGLAALYSAERYAVQGRAKDAVIQAKQAQNRLSKGSPAWHLAQDILDLNKAIQKKK